MGYWCATQASQARKVTRNGGKPKKDFTESRKRPRGKIARKATRKKRGRRVLRQRSEDAPALSAHAASAHGVQSLRRQLFSTKGHVKMGRESSGTQSGEAHGRDYRAISPASYPR